MSELATDRTATDAPGITIIEFMYARLDEEERAALDVAEDWSRLEVDLIFKTYIARYSPERVLADIEARRGIVRRFERVRDGEAPELQSSPQHALPRLTLGEVVWRLATAYAGHPDFRDEWATPDGRDEWRRAPLPR